ncbi:MAG: hypothetical protein H0U95_06440 [Bacteroidetes bacterium]|nr:hypothetical protein [Bacteroidota bacterium]
MKKFFVPIALFTLLFSSCKISQLSSYQDDVYTSPSEEKKLARIAEAEKAKKDAAEKQKQQDEALAQKAKDDSNPYYKDPQYNSDDYYDYKYASQIRRFNNPVSGAGYYNNYYTNSYMYNQNPNMYGSSIYSSYNYNMPSNQFGNYSNGLSMSFGTGNYYNNSYGGYNPYYSTYNPYYSNYYYGCNNMYGGYNPYSYGYNPYSYNPYSYNPYGYNPYMMGYNNGFNSGSNWGYFNSYDVNSSYSHAEYGPRGSNGGGNGHRQTTAGMAVPEGSSVRQQFINEVAVKQESTPRFIDVPHKTISNTTTDNFGGGQTTSSGSGKTTGTDINYPNNNSNTSTTPVATPKQEGFWPRIFSSDNQNTNLGSGKNTTTDNGSNTNTNPVRNTNNSPGRSTGSSETYNPNNGNSGSGKSVNGSIDNNGFQNNTNSSNRNTGGNSNFGGGDYNSGGSSSPRGSGGGSNHPR